MQEIVKYNSVKQIDFGDVQKSISKIDNLYFEVD